MTPQKDMCTVEAKILIAENVASKASEWLRKEREVIYYTATSLSIGHKSMTSLYCKCGQASAVYAVPSPEQPKWRGTSRTRGRH